MDTTVHIDPNTSCNLKSQDDSCNNTSNTIYAIKSYEGNTYVGYFEDPTLAIRLKTELNIIATPIGLTCHRPMDSQTRCAPFELDEWSLAFIAKYHLKSFNFNDEFTSSFTSIPNLLSQVTQSDSYRVFEDLIRKKYYVISAKKFGAAFLAYDSDPSLSHAKYLVFIRKEQRSSQTEQQLHLLTPTESITPNRTNNEDSIITTNRLATIAKKEALLATVVHKIDQSNEYIIKYAHMQRLQHY